MLSVNWIERSGASGRPPDFPKGVGHALSAPAETVSPPAHLAPPPAAGAALDTTLSWLKEPGAELRGQLDKVMSTAQELARPLAQHWQTQLLLGTEI
jgi:hypothetical protein